MPCSNIFVCRVFLTYAPLLDRCKICCELDGEHWPAWFKLAFDIITHTSSLTTGKDLYFPSEIPEFILLVLFSIDLILISHLQSLHNEPDVNFLVVSLRVGLL